MYRLWQRFRPHFERWMSLQTSPSLELEYAEAGIQIQVARDHLEALRPGVMQIDVAD